MLKAETASIAEGRQISDELFGGNVLAHTIPISGSGGYSQAIDDLGVTTLRFPGGAITEELFDITQPDRDIVFNPKFDSYWRMTPLTDFMNFAGENGHEVVIVLPTVSALSQNVDEHGNRSPQIDEEALRNFISKVSNGEYGSARVKAFEIGNEYWGSGEMNAVEYGHLAAEMSVIIDEELTKSGSTHTDIIVQKGHNFGSSRLNEQYEGLTAQQALNEINADYETELGEEAIFSNGEVNWTHVNNQLIINAFDTQAEWDAIDGVVAHIYSRGSVNETIRHFALDQIDETWLAKDPSLKQYVTEWNMQSTANLDMERDYGLFQAHEMLNIMEEFVTAGVDHALVWPLIQRTANPLAEGTAYSEKTAPGEMYAHMSEHLPGKTMIDLNPDHRDTEFEDGPLSIHIFAGEQDLVAYIANTSKTATSDASVDLSSFVENFDHADLQILGVEAGNSPGDTSSPAALTKMPWDRGSVTLDADLAPGEIMQVVLKDVEPASDFEEIWNDIHSAPLQTPPAPSQAALTPMMDDIMNDIGAEQSGAIGDNGSVEITLADGMVPIGEPGIVVPPEEQGDALEEPEDNLLTEITTGTDMLLGGLAILSIFAGFAG